MKAILILISLALVNISCFAQAVEKNVKSDKGREAKPGAFGQSSEMLNPRY